MKSFVIRLLLLALCLSPLGGHAADMTLEPGTNYWFKDFSGLTIVGSGSSGVFTHTNFSYANVSASFESAHLDNVLFIGATIELTPDVFTGATFLQCSFARTNVTLDYINSAASCVETGFDGLDFSNGTVTAGMNFHGSNFQGTNLSHTNLNGANMSNALLYNANLEGANLAGVDLTNAFLVGADLRNTNAAQAITNVQLRQAMVVKEVNLAGNNLVW